MVAAVPRPPNVRERRGRWGLSRRSPTTYGSGSKVSSPKRYPRARTGRPRADLRRVLNGVIFRMRSGCHWNQLPTYFGDDSTVHRWFQRWSKDGVLQAFWALLASECDELDAVDWRWLGADALMNKSRFGGDETGQNPTDRAKRG